MIIRMDQPLANDYPEGLTSRKWSSGSTRFFFIFFLFFSKFRQTNIILSFKTFRLLPQILGLRFNLEQHVLVICEFAVVYFVFGVHYQHLCISYLESTSSTCVFRIWRAGYEVGASCQVAAARRLIVCWHTNHTVTLTDQHNTVQPHITQKHYNYLTSH